MNLNPSNLAIFALIASIGAFWNQLRGLIQRFFSFFVRTDEIKSFDDARHFMKIILDKGKVIRWGNTVYRNGHRDHLKKFNCNYHFVFATNQSLMVIIDKTFIIINDNNNMGVKVTYLFGCFNIKGYLEEAYLRGVNFTKELEKEQFKRFFVCERGGQPQGVYPTSSNGQLAAAVGSAPTTPDQNSGVFADYNFLREHNKYLLINYTDIGSDIKIGENKSYYWQKEGLQFKEEVNFWLKHRDWYEKRGLMWRRGCLLSSSPGQGKSKMVLETARELDLPLYRFDISTMSNSEFQDNFNSVEYGSIIALEDIDTVFNLRENVQQKNLQKQLLTFDCLINTINGVKENSGVFLVITTNKLDMLDPALTRAGRLDAKIEVGPLDEGGRRFIAQNILIDWPEEIGRVVEEKANISVVEFTHICMERAIELFNKKKL